MTPEEALKHGVFRILKQSDILKCPHVIMDPRHYLADGSCRCNDPTHTEMSEWGYTWNNSRNRWIAPADPEEDSEDPYDLKGKSPGTRPEDRFPPDTNDA